ncbi:MAG: type II toxin-antitoxin system HicA family toxin [Oscillospiraceae bacterium]|nr:type II toxin-antitoxin system HicA family toxin [Oscillospiraceae bacterium]
MPSVEKIIEKMRNQPHGIRLPEAEKVLAAYDYSFKRQKGSHRHYLNKQGDLITLKDPLKISYINELLERIGEK